MVHVFPQGASTQRFPQLDVEALYFVRGISLPWILHVVSSWAHITFSIFSLAWEGHPWLNTDKKNHLLCLESGSYRLIWCSLVHGSRKTVTKQSSGTYFTDLLQIYLFFKERIEWFVILYYLTPFIFLIFFLYILFSSKSFLKWGSATPHMLQGADKVGICAITRWYLFCSLVANPKTPNLLFQTL